ncbi:MAG: phosphatase PAP2 family protein [Candidatus Aegiribacteria sp.]|nr:phosphatase PAP2 family protein [Candidatus Aegiribacteria sp.]
MPKKIRSLLRSLVPLVSILFVLSEVTGDDFIHFISEDIHHMFSRKPLLIAGIGGAVTAGAFLLESREGYEGFVGEGCLRNCSEVCDRAFGLPLIGASSIMWAGGAIIGSSDTEETGQMLTEGLLLTYGLTGAMKIASGRARPDGSDSHSFPSGHSSGTACAAVILWDTYGPGAGIPAAAIATFTALSRISLGKHYPSDVVAGAAIGLSVGLAVAAAHEDDGGSDHHIQPTLGIRWSSSEGFGVYF